MLKPPGNQRLKPKSDKLLSKFAFKFNLRRYTPAPAGDRQDDETGAGGCAAPEYRGHGAPVRLFAHSVPVCTGRAPPEYRGHGAPVTLSVCLLWCRRGRETDCSCVPRYKPKSQRPEARSGGWIWLNGQRTTTWGSMNVSKSKNKTLNLLTSLFLGDLSPPCEVSRPLVHPRQRNSRQGHKHGEPAYRATAPSPAAAAAAAAPHHRRRRRHRRVRTLVPAVQGLTLVQFSAQLERFVWDRGCA
jgi:hypothetical protein